MISKTVRKLRGFCLILLDNANSILYYAFKNTKNKVSVIQSYGGK